MADEATEELSKLSTAQLVRHSRPAPADLEPTQGGVAAGTDTRNAMFPRTETEGFRIRWNDIQADFVDSPRQSVQKADELVGAIIQRLTEVFSAEQEKLRAIGVRALRFQRRTFGKHSAATGPSSIVCFPSRSLRESGEIWEGGQKHAAAD
jgi:hypothetical protein